MRHPASILAVLTVALAVSHVRADNDKFKDGGSTYGSTPSLGNGSEPATATQSFAPKLRLAVDYGIAHCYANESSSSSGSADDLRTGGNLGVSGEYMITPQLGLGIIYSRFASSTTSSGVDLNMTVGFIGAVLSTRSGTSGAAFIASVALGQASYELEGSEGSSSATAKGSGLGLRASLGGEFYLTPHAALAIEINTLNATAKDVKLQSVNLGDANVSNIGAAGGLHIYL